MYTSVYPILNDKSDNTKVVHYFCKSWAEAGHDIMVIHNISRFPHFYYFIVGKFVNLISSNFGVVIPSKFDTKSEDYVLDKVRIFRRPMLKYLPYGLFSKKKIRLQHREILNIIRSNRFQPDILIGHWENPQMQLLALFKNDFPLIRTTCVIHSQKYFKSRFFKDSLPKIDNIGFRNDTFLHNFRQLFNDYDGKLFQCASGIPEIFSSVAFSKPCFDKHLHTKVSLIFVGMLIKRKNPVQLVEVTKLLLKNLQVTLTVVGEGSEKNKVMQSARRLGIEEFVHITGKLDRIGVREYLLQGQIFVMVSDKEAFGLVYLEAMACGCIVIATLGGGVDGIVSHGVNGFLCEFGDLKALFELLTFIIGLPFSEKKKIIENAMRTAQEYSDKNMSTLYLANVIGKL